MTIGLAGELAPPPITPFDIGLKLFRGKMGAAAWISWAKYRNEKKND
jgi:hypothetical protein